MLPTKPDTGTAHTAGPWNIEENTGWDEAWCNWHQVGPISLMGGEATANSRLIAASPELLADLTEIVDRFECALEAVHATKTDRALIRRARKTIAKATGAQS